MVWPAVLWLTAIFLSILLGGLAITIMGLNNYLSRDLPTMTPLTWSSWMRAVPIRDGTRVVCARTRVAFSLYALSELFDEAARGILPQLSLLNDSRLSEKIRKACAVARLDNFSQLWVDTSCIDKTSSSELSEAINSMFAWYRDAAVCYVYLADVPRSDDLRRPGSAFRRSRWFTRGWTLQELIAPRVVVFLSREWEIIGTKENLADLVEDITGIDRDVLVHKKSHTELSIAARMSWAAERATTRVEDQAYCLLGIFGIIMTPIYGEGEHAFRRLQEEILRHIPDDSIFAWEMLLEDPREESRPPVASLSQDAAVSDVV
ncbi:hypothetical protein GSI_08652 [Ganoderma sinense ZZ0214-1]|uniref:Uncharacterized protein n=1 Tax=Ganoderma sinense ZZ0214-1 TaxID=1077348 RepID=A0A2G8S4B2_9APHY|nr:hypothetical protein GSI_08652 [Ganoderma sinense ZZ0214-1]